MSSIHGAGQQRRRSRDRRIIKVPLRTEHPMGDKSPKKANAKKPAKSKKEKRAAKNKKRRETSERALLR